MDDLDNSTSGLIWLGNNDGFIFFGSEQNEEFNKELNDFIDNVIQQEAKKAQLKWFEGIGNHEKWNSAIESVFKHRKLGSWNQRVYTLQRSDYKDNDEPILGQEYQVVKIRPTILDNNSIKNIEFLRSKILEFWSSFNHFFHHGIGYCIIYKNEIISVCFSGFVAGNIHCIEIETLEAHQGKKLAQKLAHCFIKDCLENDIVPYWDCMEMNQPSVTVAEKLGFKNIFNYVGYDFPL